MIGVQTTCVTVVRRERPTFVEDHWKMENGSPSPTAGLVGRIMIVDAPDGPTAALAAGIQDERLAIDVTRAGHQSWAEFERRSPDVVVIALELPDADGLRLLRRMKRTRPEVELIATTQPGASIDRSVAAMSLGAYDVLHAVMCPEVLRQTIHEALKNRGVAPAPWPRSFLPGAPVWASARMKRLVADVQVIAANRVPVVLVNGESGTGKQVIARMLHDRSDRAQGPFVELNCSAIPENLVESELFGHERGAFSDAHERKLGLVEVADGGTLFLDEIGDLSRGAQAKLLTFLEQRTFRRVGGTTVQQVDVRIVAATNRDLAAMAAERTFREDLWYRLNPITLSLPPLRERTDDVLLLAEHFLAEATREYHRRWRAISASARRILLRYPWPGNVRELRAMMYRVTLLHDAEVLQAEHLPADIVARAITAPRTEHDHDAEAEPPPIATLAEVEREYIEHVVARCGGNQSLAARHLGITRQTLAKKLKSWSEEE
jgi:two-component system, NtrC family, response regulator AtoC